jgi:hypothetical protein
MKLVTSEASLAADLPDTDRYRIGRGWAKSRHGFAADGLARREGGSPVLYRLGWLTPPTRAVFLISVILAAIALLVWRGIVNIPIIQSNLFKTLLIAYGILLAGT